jgi:hypothetical protein
MANPEYHRRQAELFIRLSEVATDAGMAAEMERLAAEHSAWARWGESGAKGSDRPARQSKEAQRRLIPVLVAGGSRERL